MIAQINQLIDQKLSLLYATTDATLPLNDFKNTPKSKLQDAKILAEMMQRKQLINLHSGEELRYELTDFGKQICENGGWLQYLEKQKSEIKKTLVQTEPNTEIKNKTGLKLYVKSIIGSLSDHKNKR